MEPLNDDELQRALRMWKAPAAPDSLTVPRCPWWQWLLTGSIRVPVPVTAFAAVILALLAFQALRRSPAPQPPAAVSFRDFQPVTELKPVIIRRIQHEEH